MPDKPHRTTLFDLSFNSDTAVIPSPKDPKTIEDNALEIMKLRYFMSLPHDGKEQTYSELCRRVSKIMASGETLYTNEATFIRELEESIYNDMMAHRFLFNSPALFSAGTGMSVDDELSRLMYEETKDSTLGKYKKLFSNINDNQMLFACFVIPIDDSLEAIFDGLKEAATISKFGGGVGTNFSHLREKSSLINGGIGGKSSGPVSFMQLWNTMGSVVVQGGKRRAALMGMLNSSHPDIEEFVQCKTEEGNLSYFNISVALDDKFMAAVKNDDEYDLISPHTNKTVRTIKARKLWDDICTAAHKRGDPGIFFVDSANKDSLLKLDKDYTIESTNPCLTGDTLVAVADGRGAVAIKQLVEEEKDVPVYTEDEGGHIVIRMMCHPRLTGKNKDIVKVTLSDGNVIRCTKNHQFILSDGTLKEAKDLVLDDSLSMMSRATIDVEAYIDNSHSDEIAPEYTARYRNTRFLKSILLDKNIADDRVYVEKTCETCGKKFKLSYDEREICYCSPECAAHHEDNNITYTKIVRDCNVVSVVDDGVEDVYNGTVDDYHSLFIGGKAKDHYRYFVACKNCGEQPLLVNKTNRGGSSCNLGSINIFEFIDEDVHGKKYLNKPALIAQIYRSMYYLDNVIDVTRYPLDNIAHNTKEIRPVGLGIMGLADAAIKLDLVYGSKEFLDFCDEVGKLFGIHSLIASICIGYKKGSFDKYDVVDELFSEAYLSTTINNEKLETWEELKDYIKKNRIDDSYLKEENNVVYYIFETFIESEIIPPTLKNALKATLAEESLAEAKVIFYGMIDEKLRNSRRLSIAPTGTISLLLNTSSSIEPNFAFEWTRAVNINATDKQELVYHHRLYDEYKDTDLLVTAHDLDIPGHVETVKVFAKYIDSAISKTVNLPFTATVDDVKHVYETCYENNIKGITIYRDGSRNSQPLHITEPSNSNKKYEREPILFGFTQKSSSSYGSVYTTLNFDKDGAPREVFVNIGKSGSLAKSLSESVSRTISISLQNGTKMENLINTLKGIADSEYPWVYEGFDGKEAVCRSIPDMISLMMENLKQYFDVNVKDGFINLKNKHSVVSVPSEEKPKEDTVDINKKDVCPDCGKMLVNIGGCKSCPNCGFSYCK